MLAVGREALVARVRDVVGRGGSVLVLGEPGAGKSHLLQRLADHLEADEVLQVFGADGEADVPFVAFAPVIGRFGLSADDGLALYTDLPGALKRAGALVVIDDVDRLDRASSVLVAQLARADVPLVATARGTDDLPRSLADGAGSVWTTERLEPLSPDEVLEVARTTLGHDLDAPSAALLVTRAYGNPWRVVEICTAAANGARLGEAGLSLGRLRHSRALQARALTGIEGLSEQAVEVAGLLAVAGRLPVAVLRRDAVLALDHAQLTTSESAWVRLSDPLLQDLIESGLSDTDYARLCLAAADSLARAGEEPELATRLRVRGGAAVGAAERHRAAQRSLVQHAYREAIDVLTACDCGEDALILGTARSALGELDEAEVDLERAAATAATAARALHELGVLHAVRRSDPGRAVQRLRDGMTQIPADDQRRLSLDLVKWRLMNGETVEAGELPAAEAAVVDDVTEIGVSLIGAMIASLDGAPEEALALVDRGTTVLDRDDLIGPPFARDLLELSSYLAQAVDGHLIEAESFALARRDRASTTAHPSLGMWEFATAELAMHAGRLSDAHALASRARRHLAWHDFTGLRPVATALAAAVIARSGDQAVAEEIAASIPEDQHADIKVRLHLARVQAEAALRTHDPLRAAVTLAEAGEAAVAEHHTHFGVLALDEAVNIAPAGECREGLINTLADLAPTSTLAHNLAFRSRAFAAGDPGALAESATVLSESGFLGRAIHAARAAATTEERNGRSEQARRHQRLAVLLASTSRAEPWPSAIRPTLSPREVEVALLAAQRLRSREIAQACGLAVRTVENHLANIYRKLGVASRDELAAALEEIGPFTDHLQR